jgi:nucleoside-diphosphate-sugar epimerase
MGNPPRTLADLTAAKAFPAPNPSAPRYVPSTHRARQELNLHAVIDLPDAIGRTIEWARD